jgi:tRNA A-37 threonylcarbamoyl transferase component Bud32
MAHPVLGSPSGGSQDAAGRPVTRFEQLDLGRQLGNSVWLAHADGDLVAARVATAAVFDPDSQDRDTGSEMTAALAAVHTPHLVPLVGIAHRNDATWLVSEYVEGVSLSRLVAAATLTPVQAAYVAARLLRGVAGLHEAGICHGRLTAANVLIGVDGEPWLTDWALASLAEARGFEDTVAQDLTGARRLVADLARNADRPAVRHRGRFQGLMAELDRVSTAEDVGAAASAGRLERALLDAVGDATSMAGTRGEIGALVVTLVRRRSPHDAPEGTPRPTPVPVPETLPSGRLSEADWRRTTRRPWLHAGIAVVVAAALAGGGYAFAKEPAGNLVDRVLNRGDGHSAGPLPRTDRTPTSPGTSTRDGEDPVGPTPGPVPELGPPRAGAITGVSLRPLTACVPGSACMLRVTARIAPSTSSREVVMQVSVANRCTGAIRTAPAETVTAQPGWTSVFVTSSVRLPKAGSLAAVAVTTAPARAASPPLLVPATGGSC